MTYLSIIYDAAQARVRVFQDTLMLGLDGAGRHSWSENIDKTFYHPKSNTLVSANGMNISFALALELQAGPPLASHDELLDACHEIFQRYTDALGNDAVSAAIVRAGRQANVWLAGFDAFGLRWSVLRLMLRDGMPTLERLDWRDRLQDGKPRSFPKKSAYRATFEPESMLDSFPEAVRMHAKFAAKADIRSRVGESALFTHLLGWHLSAGNALPSIGGELIEYSTDASGNFTEDRIFTFPDNAKLGLADEPVHLCYEELTQAEDDDDPAMLHLRRLFAKLEDAPPAEAA